jgi:hypothetical protein
VFLLDDNHDDHGVRRANTAQALACWRRLGALHEAIKYAPLGDVPRAVLPRLNGRRIHRRLRYIFYIVDNRVAKNKLIAQLFYQIN